MAMKYFRHMGVPGCRRMALIALGLFLGICCGSQASKALPDGTTSATKNAADHCDFAAAISARDFSAHVKILASDEFGGRAPGTTGEEKTLQYLVAQFQRMGLAPGNGDSYFQTVTVMTSKTDVAHSSMHIVRANKRQELLFGKQMLIATRTGKS